MTDNKVATSFHEGFPISMPSIAGILKVAIEKKGSVSSEDLKLNVSLGDSYIKAMPRYARACGLISIDGFEPTCFGEIVYKEDPSLTSLSTLWLMHYHMSVLHGAGPIFWNLIVTKILKFGSQYNSVNLGVEISKYLFDKSGGKLQERTTKDSARAFLKSYSKSDGFGGLGILNENKNKYFAEETEAPPIWVIGYALADYWENVYHGRASINVGDVAATDGFASLFFIGSGLLSTYFSELQREGMLQVQRVAPPHQLVKLWPNKEFFLERIYA